MSSSTHPASTCHNCHTDAPGNFCSACGQTTAVHMPSAREFLHEFVAHYVALEGKLWRTLALLLFRPGALSNEYLAGRRVRYVEPLRVYLTFSILFFAILKFSSPDMFLTVHDQQAQVGAHGPRQAPENQTSAMQVSILGQTPTLPRQWQDFEQLPTAEKQKLVVESFFHYAPYAMFCLMPLFALFLKILYLGSGRRYGEHFLFALHTNAFAFITMALMLLIPVDLVRLVLGAWLLAYLPWAMWRVYPSGKLATVCRWLLLMVAYSLAMSLAIVACIAIGVMLRH
ncbi:DUF3667 domain-containing protein [Janthinobacterium sp. SUN206]|uniref:DUF3667 domain-containing protein n=1 Tax=Janthinobacterium sp. SUN206 TaxID=3014787 RepID=UPI0027134982|nr:DUF3667 domain-containing protein [Janthinobacterium sp. SUN206]MDO8069618.1 DUF3667 domain-containing protein [Janthinobacterium sp. SUN206]